MSLVPKSAEFSLGASRHLLLAKLGALVAAGLIVASLSLLVWAKLLALAMLIFLGFASVVGYWRHPRELLVLVDSAANAWQLLITDRNDQTKVLDLSLAETQFVTGRLVILYFKTAGGRQLIRVIPHDSLPPSQHRLLRLAALARTNSG